MRDPPQMYRGAASGPNVWDVMTAAIQGNSPNWDCRFCTSCDTFNQSLWTFFICVWNKNILHNSKISVEGKLTSNPTKLVTIPWVLRLPQVGVKGAVCGCREVSMLKQHTSSGVGQEMPLVRTLTCVRKLPSTVSSAKTLLFNFF